MLSAIASNLANLLAPAGSAARHPELVPDEPPAAAIQYRPAPRPPARYLSSS